MFFPALPPLMVALYAVPLHSGRRRAWTAAVLTVTAMALAAAFFQPGPLLGPQRVGAVAWMGLATVVGDSVRNRRAYVRALETGNAVLVAGGRIAERTAISAP
jgi:hypothetical protein